MPAMVRPPHLKGSMPGQTAQQPARLCQTAQQNIIHTLQTQKKRSRGEEEEEEEGGEGGMLSAHHSGFGVYAFIEHIYFRTSRC